MLTWPGEAYDKKKLENAAHKMEGDLVSVTITGLRIVSNASSGRTSMILTVFSPEPEAARNAAVGHFKPRTLNLHCVWPEF